MGYSIFETTRSAHAFALAKAAAHAASTGERLRILTGQSLDGRTWLKYAVGGGIWTAPIHSSDYRDGTPAPPVYCQECGATDGAHFRDCRVW